MRRGMEIVRKRGSVRPPWRFVKLENGCECFVSVPRAADGGYTRVHMNYEVTMDIRSIIYTARNGKIPEGYWIVNTCGNKQCCKRDHMKVEKRRWRDKINDERRARIIEYLRRGWTIHAIAWAVETTAPSVKRIAFENNLKFKI